MLSTLETHTNITQGHDTVATRYLDRCERAWIPIFFCYI